MVNMDAFDNTMCGSMFILWAELTIRVNGDVDVQQLTHMLVWPYISTCTIDCIEHVVRHYVTHVMGLFPQKCG